MGRTSQWRYTFSGPGFRHKRAVLPEIPRRKPILRDPERDMVKNLGFQGQAPVFRWRDGVAPGKCRPELLRN